MIRYDMKRRKRITLLVSQLRVEFEFHYNVMMQDHGG